MSNTEVEILVALLAGLLSGVFSELGGAGALVSLPMLISVGLPPLVANGTNRIGTMALYTSAYFSYRAHHGRVELTAAWVYAIPVLIGTVIGSLVAVKMSDQVMQWTIVALIIAMALFSALAPNVENVHKASEKPLEKFNISAILLMFLVGLYCGLIAQVMAYLAYFVLVRWIGIDKEVAVGMKFFLAMIVTPVALVMFIAFGHINWLAGLFLFIGAAFGGFIGERILTVMRHKSTSYFILLSLTFSLLYLSIFLLNHYSNGINTI